MVGFMATKTRQDTEDKKTKQLLHYLDLAMAPKVGQEAAVDNFSTKLLRGLDYDNANRIVFIRHAIPFLICGENSVSQTDICILDDNEILLLLQVDEKLTSMKDPEPQIIAEAIAAFALNNWKQECDLYLPLCDSIMFSYLTIAVQTGTFPEIETHVFHYICHRAWGH